MYFVQGATPSRPPQDALVLNVEEGAEAMATQSNAQRAPIEYTLERFAWVLVMDHLQSQTMYVRAGLPNAYACSSTLGGLTSGRGAVGLQVHPPSLRLE